MLRTLCTLRTLRPPRCARNRPLPWSGEPASRSTSSPTPGERRRPLPRSLPPPPGSAFTAPAVPRRDLAPALQRSSQREQPGKISQTAFKILALIFYEVNNPCPPPITAESMPTIRGWAAQLQIRILKVRLGKNSICTPAAIGSTPTTRSWAAHSRHRIFKKKGENTPWRPCNPHPAGSTPATRSWAAHLQHWILRNQMGIMTSAPLYPPPAGSTPTTRSWAAW